MHNETKNYKIKLKPISPIHTRYWRGLRADELCHRCGFKRRQGLYVCF